MPTLTFLGHATFTIAHGEHTVLIDPFLTGNPQASASAGDVSCTHIAITHGHADHFSDCPDIAKRTGAPVYGSFEVCEYLGGEHGIEKLEPGNPGGCIATDFGSIAYTAAVHSSSYNGRYMGLAMGIVVNIGGKTIFHAGDTALFGDLKLIGEIHKPDLVILPVGDRFTMGPAQAKTAAEWIGAKIAVPCHYGTWPLLTNDISAFKPEGVRVEVMEPGGAFTL